MENNKLLLKTASLERKKELYTETSYLLSEYYLLSEERLSGGSLVHSEKFHFNTEKDVDISVWKAIEDKVNGIIEPKIFRPL